MNERVLLVEPDPDLGSTLAFVLESQGYQVQVGRNLASARASLATGPAPELVISEVALGDGRGFDLCASVRADPRCQSSLFMFVSASAEEIDRVVAFEVGADDFVAKPFSVRELLLRLRALVRRVRPSNDAGEVVVHGRLEVDRIRRRATLAGRDLGLSPYEVKVLHLLAAQPESVFGREEIVAAVWGEVGRVQARTVDCAVKRIRRKLGPEGRALETVRGVGFRWRRRATR